MMALDQLTRTLDVLCPMHLVISDTGMITHAGPTVQKLRPETTLAREQFLDVFDLKRPRSIEKISDLWANKGTKMHLQLRAAPQTEIKGVLMPAPLSGHSPAGVDPFLFLPSFFLSLMRQFLSFGEDCYLWVAWLQNRPQATPDLPIDQASHEGGEE